LLASIDKVLLAVLLRSKIEFDIEALALFLDEGVNLLYEDESSVCFCLLNMRYWIAFDDEVPEVYAGSASVFRYFLPLLSIS